MLAPVLVELTSSSGEGSSHRGRRTTVDPQSWAAVARIPEIGAQAESDEKLGGKQTGAST